MTIIDFRVSIEVVYTDYVQNVLIVAQSNRLLVELTLQYYHNWVVTTTYYYNKS